jgi:hypothetical protein
LFHLSGSSAITALTVNKMKELIFSFVPFLINVLILAWPDQMPATRIIAHDVLLAPAAFGNETAVNFVPHLSTAVPAMSKQFAEKFQHSAFFSQFFVAVK